jgi:hypothetical protein
VIRYQYNQQIEPPAPFLHVVLQNPATGEQLRPVPAQIDSAADRTVLPESVVQALQLAQMGTMVVGGLGGITLSLPTYAVLLGVHDRTPQPVKVIASTEEKWVLLGRDVLNAHRVVLDGPQTALELE